MRTNNSVRNILTSLVGQTLGILTSFVGRTIFINILGTMYLGINGLFSNILSILSLAEMGIGSAIIYSLYKPLAERDYKKINALMTLYAKAYKVIGITIFVLGISISPFLKFIIKDTPDIPNLVFIYILFLMNTVVSYFFSYKRTLIIADQKSYITTVYRYGFYIILNIVQIIVLILTSNFIVFLSTQIIITLTENILISQKADKMYPFLLNKNNDKLDYNSKNEIVKNVKALMCHRIGGVVVSGTDNILISSFVGVEQVGIYSNYFLVVNAINIVVSQIFNAVTASVGNLNVNGSSEKSYDIYQKMLFANFWIAGFCSITLVEVLNLFIELWIGQQYLFNINLLLIIVINFYMALIRKTTLVYKDALGLFWHDRYKSIIEAIINLIVSIILVNKIGIIGIFIGTFISTITTAFWIEPYILYKYGFEKKFSDYLLKFIKYTSIILITTLVTHNICNLFNSTTWIVLVIKILICIVSINGIFLVVFHNDEKLKYFIILLKKCIDKIKVRLIEIIRC